MSIYCLIGISGFLLSVTLYFAMLRVWMSQLSIWYPTLNLVATILISVSLVDQFNLTSALMGGTYGAISVYGIWSNRHAR